MMINYGYNHLDQIAVPKIGRIVGQKNKREITTSGF